MEARGRRDFWRLRKRFTGYFDQCIQNSIDGELNDKNFKVPFNSIIENLQTLKEYKPQEYFLQTICLKVELKILDID